MLRRSSVCRVGADASRAALGKLWMRLRARSMDSSVWEERSKSVSSCRRLPVKTRLLIVFLAANERGMEVRRLQPRSSEERFGRQSSSPWASWRLMEERTEYVVPSDFRCLVCFLFGFLCEADSGVGWSGERNWDEDKGTEEEDDEDDEEEDEEPEEERGEVGV